ncbi:hypothetical protein [Streptomyces sp. NPDC048644]|uniref:hypothetical protein n=1 Tax=Streptomyces sp. NPDC048644 TaxID=3365582 RepID=UPI003721463C
MYTHGPGPLRAEEQSELRQAEGPTSRQGSDPNQLPIALSELTAPTSGTVSLGMYRIALNADLYDDCVRYLDGNLLTPSWPRLQKMVGRGIRTAWEETVPGLYTNSAEAAV